MFTSEYSRKLNLQRKQEGFYDDELRKEKWRNCRIIGNKTKIKTNNVEMLESIQKSKIDEKWLETQLLQKRITQIKTELKNMGIKHTKLAFRHLKEKTSPQRLKQIAHDKRISALKTTLQNNPEIRLLFIYNRTKDLPDHIRKYRSKGELRLKKWLQENYPEYDWAVAKIKYDDKILEFDIYSRKFNDFYIEYNGICHYKALWGESNFNRIQKNDRLKVELMKALGKRFLIVKDNNTSFERQIDSVKNWIRRDTNPLFS